MRKKNCNALPGREEEGGGTVNSLIKLSGFNACNTRDYSTVWRDMPDCHDNNSTNVVIGSYWLQAITNVMKEGRGVVCEAPNSVFRAEVLVSNLLVALQVTSIAARVLLLITWISQPKE